LGAAIETEKYDKLKKIFGRYSRDPDVVQDCITHCYYHPKKRNYYVFVDVMRMHFGRGQTKRFVPVDSESILFTTLTSDLPDNKKRIVISIIRDYGSRKMIQNKMSVRRMLFKYLILGIYQETIAKQLELTGSRVSQIISKEMRKLTDLFKSGRIKILLD